MKKRAFGILLGIALLLLLLSLSACEPEQVHTHTMTEWAGRPEATCTTDGFYTRGCTSCSYYEERTVEPLGHDMVTHTAKEPTCLEGGYAEYVACSRCDTPDHDTLPALGHDYGADGICSRCPANKYLTFTSNGDGTCYFSKYSGKAKEVVIPAYSETGERVVAIGSDAFNSCRGIGTLTLPEGLLRLEKGAFAHANIHQIILPSTLVTIEEKAFFYASIGSIHIPKSVSYIGAEAFIYCEDMTSISFEDGIRLPMILERTFAFCTALEEIVIPETVLVIEDQTFLCCDSLAKITLPEGVTELSFALFDSCKSLSSIVIPDTVTAIGGNLFASCYGLTEVTLPSTLTEIPSGAFDYCESLTSIHIPAGVISIGDAAFRSCTSLSEIVFEGNKVASLGSYAFAACTSLSRFTVPESVTYIGDRCFMSAGCTEIAFDNPRHWYEDTLKNPLDVSDAAENARLLTDRYGNGNMFEWRCFPPEGV